METIFETATLEDVPALITLINSAYRGNEARNGWTHEADLIEGNERINEAGLISIINQPGTIVLLCKTGTTIQGCVLLEKQENKIYLGMLSVSPGMQAKGTGKLLMQQAELYAKAQGIYKIEMTVIAVRTELIEWYKRRGYVDTGKRKPFPANEGFGTPKQKLEFAVLEKHLPQP